MRQLQLLAFQLKFAIFMEEVKQKYTVNIAILQYCLVFFITYITNRFASVEAIFIPDALMKPFSIKRGYQKRGI